MTGQQGRRRRADRYSGRLELQGLFKWPLWRVLDVARADDRGLQAGKTAMKGVVPQSEVCMVVVLAMHIDEIILEVLLKECRSGHRADPSAPHLDL